MGQIMFGIVKGALTLGAVALSALLLAGCAAPDSAGGASAPPDAVAQKASEAIKADLIRPTSIGVTAPLEGPVPKGKVIYWMQCGSPACAVVGGAIKEATDAVGWELKVIDAGLTPESIKAAWQQAVLGDPDAVLTSGFSRALFEEELAQLSARNVPVLNMTTAEPPEKGITAAQKWGPDFTEQGARLANYVLSRAGKHTNAVAFSTSAFPNIKMVSDSFSKTISESCPECQVDIEDLPIDALGNDLSTRVVTYLQSHPDVNWVYMGYSDMMIGLPAALEAGGIDDSVGFVTLDTSPTTSAYLSTGKYLQAVDTSPTWEAAFRQVDFLLRYFNGEDTEPSTAHTLPVWIVTKDTLPSTTEDFPLVVDYAKQYEELWGVTP